MTKNVSQEFGRLEYFTLEEKTIMVDRKPLVVQKFGTKASLVFPIRSGLCENIRDEEKYWRVWWSLASKMSSHLYWTRCRSKHFIMNGPLIFELR